MGEGRFSHAKSLRYPDPPRRSRRNGAVLGDPALWIALRDLPGLRRSDARDLIRRFGDPEAIFGRRVDELEPCCGPDLARRLAGRPLLGPARAELELARAAGLQVLVQTQDGFPPLLLDISDPPLLLYVAGNPFLFSGAGSRLGCPALPRHRLELPGPCVSVVGSRRATARGRETARQFGVSFARAGLVVVSGLAYGIDAAAHTGALEAGGRTVAILAGGLDRPGPRGNLALARRILRRDGLWLSEHPLGAPPLPSYFPDRNRLISGISRATLIVEARERSGSLWTARHAADQGRAVMVVPGPVDTDACRGSNRLLVDGAVPVIDPDDALVYALDRLDVPRSASSGSGVGPLPKGDAGRILGRVRASPCGPDDLVRELGLSAARVAALLVDLELEGWLRREGRRLACASRPARVSGS